MKNFLFFFFCIFIFKTAQAQTDNTFNNLLGAGVSNLGAKKDQSKSRFWGGEFNFSHSISPTSAFGANLIYSSGGYEGSSVKTTVTSIQPEFRNYFGKSVFKGVYIAFNGEYQHVKSTWGTNSGAVGNNFGIGAGLGFNPQFGTRIVGSIKGAAGYIFNNGGSLRWNIGVGIAVKI